MSRGARRRGGRDGAPGFFERVYALVRTIPRGRVASYGQVAALLGSPRAARTVGWALRALPGESDVPWHRVVGADGRIPRAGRAATAALQATLLRREGVRVEAPGAVSLERVLWKGPRPAIRRGRWRP